MKGFLGKVVDMGRLLVKLGNAPRDSVEAQTDRPRASLAQARDMELPERPVIRRVGGAHGSGAWPAHAAPGWAGCKLMKRFAEASARSARGY